MVTRTSPDACMAFDNVCRHHGTILSKEKVGNFANKCVTCCYHGWTYSLDDGKLIRATRLKGIENFRAKDYGLHRLRMKTLGELVFLNFSKPASDESDESTIDDKFVPIDIDFPQLQFVATKTYYLNCNWKVFVDNYLDGGYHVEHAHRDLASNLNLKSYKTTCAQRHSVQTVANKPDAGDGNRYNKPASYTWIYPNLMLNRYGKWLDTNTVYPIDVEKCAVVFDWYLEKNEATMRDEGTIANELKASNQVQDEDEELCAMVQAGMHSKFFKQGRYAPNVEMAMYHFHDLLLNDLEMTVENC